MLFVQSYESDSFFITPAALAVTEPRPATIADQRWNFIIALSKTRSVKSEALYLTTPTSQQWCHIDTFFRRHRRLKWDTIRLATSGNKRKRMDFRVRHTSGYLRRSIYRTL